MRHSRALAIVAVFLLPSAAWGQPDVRLRLHETVAATCPIDGMTIGTIGLSASVTVTPVGQQACAQPIIDAFDWSQAAQDTWLTLKLRTAAKVLYTTTQDIGKALRCLVDTTISEVNILRAAAVHPITSLTRSGTTATATTAGAHGLATNDSISIFGADLPAYNRVSTLITVTGSTTFTYTGVSGNPATPATGTILYVQGGIPPATAPRTFPQFRTTMNACVDGGSQD